MSAPARYAKRLVDEPSESGVRTSAPAPCTARRVGPPLWAKPRYLPKGSESSNHHHLRVLGEPYPFPPRAALSPLQSRTARDSTTYTHIGGLGVAGLNRFELNYIHILSLWTPVWCEPPCVSTADATTTS